MTVNVLVQTSPEKGYAATVLGWPDLVVTAPTKEETLEKIKAELTHRLAQGEIISLDLDIEPKNGEDPWMKFAGMWENDPTFDDFLAEIKTYREELDKELNAA